MFHRVLPLTAIAALSVVAACAKAPTPAPIYPEPVYDKYGAIISGGCTEDGIMVDANGRPVEGTDCCIAGTSYNARTGECEPEDQGRDPGRDPQPLPDPQ